MRTRRPEHRSRRGFFGNWIGLGNSAKRGPLRRAPRRRDIERLEERELLTTTPTTNPYFESQWHLNATGQLVEQPDSPTYTQSMATVDINVLGAWDLGYTGSGVQVAVVDGGFDLTHEDLTYVLLSEVDPDTGDATVLDLIDFDNDPSFVDLSDAHGTAVAGIIGADDNTIGTVGIAHGADVVPIRLVPGDLDPGVSTEFASVLSFIQFAGIPEPGDDGSNADEVIDVFNRSYGPSDQTRVAVPLTDGEREALRNAALLGRGTWEDQDGDGVFEPDEIEALGAINVVASGNGNGTTFTFAFDSSGVLDSSQYDELANSRYTIAVGAVDYDGAYANPDTGAAGSYAETGANVLVVAPSSTFGIDITSNDGLTGGVVTTDLTGEDGSNSSPLFGVEFDNDYFVDTSYTSTFGETSAAAPQASAVIALMLEANPNLSYRDVQQILLMSAAQNDQFSETWVTNAYTFYEDLNTAPSYVYYDLDTDGDPSTIEVENAVLPNYSDPDIIRGYFLNENDLNLPDVAFNDVTGLATVLASNTPNGIDPSPLLVFGVDANLNAGGQNPFGVRSLVNPESAVNKGFSVQTTNSDNSDISGVQPLDPLINGELNFSNGAGYTVSWGYGTYLEEIGYAHGLLDAEAAVLLAEAWETYDLYLDDEITITTAIEGGTDNTRIQPRANIDLGGNIDFEIPGGISAVDIDTAYYNEFLVPITTTNIQDVDGNDIGSVITDAPFYDPEGNDDFDFTRGDSRLTIPIDPTITTDYMSVEWIEFTTGLVSGDIDDLRLTLVSPDGTHSELNPYRRPADDRGEVLQEPQLQQGQQAPGTEILGEDVAGFTATDVIDGSEINIIGEYFEIEDPLAAGDTWTWTTNRHYGELFSSEAQNFDNPNASVTGQWYIVVENWGDGAVELTGNYEVAVHGTEATGNRIQGKIGVDDNAQGIEGRDSDEVFNFDRNMVFGEMLVDGAGTGNFERFAVVLDDAGDSVFYNDNYYETIDQSTGEVFRYGVVDMFEYTALAEITRGAIVAPGGGAASMATGPFISETEALLWYSEYGAELGFDIDPTGDGLTDEMDALIWEADLAAIVFADMLAAEATEPQIGYGLVAGTSFIATTIDDYGNAFNYQNFDYSQESFASIVTVQAEQFAVEYDATGAVVGRTATGVVDYFTTGADGNYYFDVDATPAPPDIATDPAGYAQWLSDFGGLRYEYEISLTDVDQDRILTNTGNGDIGYGAVEDNGITNFEATSKTFNVQIDASDEFNNGQAVTVDDVNFLLTVDPAETNVDVSGTVYRDRNGDSVVDGFEETYAGVTVFYDANGNGSFDSGTDVETTTDANGDYSLTIPGLTSSQNVSIVVDTAFDATLTPFNPADGEQTVAVTPGSPTTDVNFAFQLAAGEPAQVSGVVFDDVDGDGVYDDTEVGLDLSRSLRVYIDTSGDGAYQVGEPSAMTAGDGTFNIESTTTGTFFVRIDDTTTVLTQTTPAAGAGISVTVAAGETTSDLEFGVFDDRTQDFGDLFVDVDNNYPTVLADNGARHIVLPDIYLGAGVDMESDGTETTDASGDDATESDDEDGVVLLNAVETDATLEFEITATGDGAALHAWIDFNNDGDWDDPGEHVFQDVGGLSPGGATTTTTLTYDLAGQGFAIEVDDTADFYAARFRWGPFGLDYDGAANAGEVEDYLLSGSEPILLTGRLREDTDGDLVFGAGDTGLAGVVLFSDTNLDGVRQISEPSATTNAQGEYSLPINSTTTTVVTVIVDQSTLPAGVVPIDPTDGVFSQTLSPGDTANADFLVGSPQGITGLVFSDDDNNSLQSGGEGGLAGITVELLNDMGVVVDTTVSDSSGEYSSRRSPARTPCGPT